MMAEEEATYGISVPGGASASRGDLSVRVLDQAGKGKASAAKDPAPSSAGDSAAVMFDRLNLTTQESTAFVLKEDDEDYRGCPTWALVGKPHLGFPAADCCNRLLRPNHSPSSSPAHSQPAENFLTADGDPRSSQGSIHPPGLLLPAASSSGGCLLPRRPSISRLLAHGEQRSCGLVADGYPRASPDRDLPPVGHIEDLARISAACTEFRRLVIDRSFLRRVLGVHTPQFLALLEEGGFHPAQPPHPSTAAAHALTFKADFTFSFVPSPHRRPGYWFVQDTSDGRVILRYALWGNHRLESTELAVCDPLHRRYIMLPAVPQEHAALVAHQDVVNNPWCEPFLGVPLIFGEDEDVGTSFNVIWVAHYETEWKTTVVAAFIFSSGTGKWKSVGEFTMVSLIRYTFSRRHYAYGCFFWELNKINKELLMLDTRSMEFSTVDLPPGEWTMNIAIVEAGEGRLGMFGIRDETGGDLCFYIRRNKGHSSAQWHMEKTMSLASGYRHYIKAATERYLLLAKCGDPWCV
ncbi:hypothetical protein ZWY2020_000504 [Hordeum vulgare]|nr:hypothetical protein ZWY2020_000504 [Hordeum vulgare]